jgi:hypothetical protein
MTKSVLFFALAFCSTLSINAQTHTKADGTPDKRYSENKTQTTPTYQSTNTEKVHVDSYEKKDGTVVEEHNRTAPNNTSYDNWSTKPNVNPETGAKGTKNPN